MQNNLVENYGAIDIFAFLENSSLIDINSTTHLESSPNQCYCATCGSANNNIYSIMTTYSTQRLSLSLMKKRDIPLETMSTSSFIELSKQPNLLQDKFSWGTQTLYVCRKIGINLLSKFLSSLDRIKISLTCTYHKPKSTPI